MKKTHVFLSAAATLLALTPAMAFAEDVMPFGEYPEATGTVYEQTQAKPFTPSPATQRAQGALPAPAMAGPLGLNTAPKGVKMPGLGTIYAGGAMTATGLVQTKPTADNKKSRGDIGNAQLWVQTTEGPVQLYVQAGAYTLPTLGVPYVSSGTTTSDSFGFLPVGYLKLVPMDNVSVKIGKLPTLIGTENTFTFQNMNIQRGILKSQVNDINHGVEVAYAAGPLTAAVAWSDGFVSGDYNWGSARIGYALDNTSKVTFSAGGNFGSSRESDTATPLAQNNSFIYNLAYETVNGPWTFTPAVQYTHVSRDTSVGIMNSASTLGASLHAKYDVNEAFSLAGRAEYIRAESNAGSPNLLYGPGSRAWSLTFTPTYQSGIFFGRAEASYLRATREAPGSVFGTGGDDNAQARVMLEAGMLF